MPINIHGKEYKTVAERVNEFYTKYAGFTRSIVTEILKDENNIVQVKATVRVDNNSLIPLPDSPDAYVFSLLGTGHAEEDRGKGRINDTSALENAETSAIGRALASIGLGGTEFASADELSNALHQQENVINKPVQKDDGSHFIQAQPKPIANGVLGLAEQAKKQMTNGTSNGTTDEITMPFGKHNGVPISKLDIQYIEWALGNLDNLDGKLHDAMTKRFHAEKAGS
mgnify:FL=1|jgi:hypothetical protein